MLQLAERNAFQVERSAQLTERKAQKRVGLKQLFIGGSGAGPGEDTDFRKDQSRAGPAVSTNYLFPEANLKSCID
jgi:hypothetical protein